MYRLPPEFESIFGVVWSTFYVLHGPDLGSPEGTPVKPAFLRVGEAEDWEGHLVVCPEAWTTRTRRL